jgi:hypothetical protein
MRWSRYASRTFPNFLLTLSDYPYAPNGPAKSPDASFVPRNLLIPPALAQPNSISPRKPLGIPFLTFVFECAYSHENWTQLLIDARTKTFSANTSIQVWVGCKLYRSDRTFRCVWGKRRASGSNMRIMRTTPRLSLDNPTTRVLRIPAGLVYWGVPVPPHIQGDFPLELEVIRAHVEGFVG